MCCLPRSKSQQYIYISSKSKLLVFCIALLSLTDIDLSTVKGVMVALLGSVGMIYSTLTSEGKPDAPGIMLIKIAFSHLVSITTSKCKF